MFKAIITTLPMQTCLFWLVLLLLEKPKRYPHRILVAFMGTAAALYLGHLAYFYDESSIQPFTDTLYVFCNLSVYPLYYLYICSLTETDMLNWKRWHVLIPAILLGAATGVMAVNGFTSGSLAVMVRLIAKCVFALEVLITVAAGLRKIGDYNSRLESFYSSTEDKSLRHIKAMLVALIAISILSFVVNAVGKQLFADSLPLLAVVSLIFSTLLFIIGHTGFKLRICAADLKEEMVPEENEVGVSAAQNELQQRIIAYITETRLYLRPNLKVSDLAELMGTNRNYIYNAINVGLGVSFNEFINGYRIDYAKHLLLNDRSMTAAEVAIASGFSSESSFYRNFKLLSGCTPENWRANNLESQSCIYPPPIEILICSLYASSNVIPSASVS